MTSERRLRLRPPTMETLVVATYGLLGVRLGARAIADNSAFLHLRTGADMVRHGLVPAIPRVDPYTFSARGEPWVVQSWLPSTVVGWVDRWFGSAAVVVLCGVTMAALAVLVATLARTGDVRRTVAAAGIALLVGAPFWTPRPLLVGLLCLALTVFVIERGKPQWWLLLIGWLWVNSHGSFPFGLLWVGLRLGGDALDERRRPAWRPAAWLAGGLALGALNPLGARLLAFPLTVGDKREIFRTVIEWRSVDFQRPDGLVALVGLVLAVVVLTRRPLVWRHALPVAVFLGLGLLAQRNLAPLGMVIAPALASALRAPGVAGAASVNPERVASGAPGAGARTLSRPPVALAVVLVALAVVFLAGAATRPAFDFSSYPVEAVRWAEGRGRFESPHRVLTKDTVGNYVELVRGRRANVFIDDRVDMFPLDVSRDYADILDAGRPAQRAIDRWRIDTVIWEADHPLVDRLLDSRKWAQFHERDNWVVLLRV